LRFFPIQIARVDSAYELCVASLGLFAGVGVFTGFWSMAKRRGKSESVVLAISTVIAVVLLFAAWTWSIQVV
jgi:hypothetical protein